MYGVELQIQQSSKRHYKCRLTGGVGHSRQVKPKILRFSIAQTFRFGIVGIPQHNDCRAFTPLLPTKRSLRVEGRKRPGTKASPSHFTQG